MIWKLIIISVILIAIALTGIAIKMFMKKDGEFKKACSSVDPKTGKRLGCTCGAEDSEESCENKHHH